MWEIKSFGLRCLSSASDFGRDRWEVGNRQQKKNNWRKIYNFIFFCNVSSWFMYVYLYTQATFDCRLLFYADIGLSE